MYRGTIRYPLNRNEPTTNKEDVLIEGWTDLLTRGCM